MGFNTFNKVYFPPVQNRRPQPVQQEISMEGPDPATPAKPLVPKTNDTELMDRSDDSDEFSPIYNNEIGKSYHSLSLDRTSLINGIILSEILEKPRSRRRGR